MLKPLLRADTLRTPLLLTVAVLLIGAAPQLVSQSQKSASPEQMKYQAQMEQWRTAREALKAKAKAALAAEMQREQAGDCPHAGTTRAAEECLAQEVKTTDKNYSVFTSSLRSMLGLSLPVMPDEPPSTGPTGKPLTSAERVREFDNLEALSKTYRTQAADAAYDEFKGGTLAPVFSLETGQKLLRSHLKELSFIYDNELSNH